MRTRIDGIRARVGLYRFAVDAFGGKSEPSRIGCVIGRRRYRITDDLLYCLRALTLCQHFLAAPSAEVEAALRATLSERED